MKKLQRVQNNLARVVCDVGWVMPTQLTYCVTFIGYQYISG